MTGEELKNKSKKITLCGKDYDVALDFNAICDLEEKYGSINNALETISSAMENLGEEKPDDGKKKRKGSIKDIRFLLTVMLRHTDENITEREVGRMLTLENLGDISKALTAAMTGSFADGDSKNAEVSPQK